MITTAMTQHVSAVSTQVSSSLVAYTMLSHVLGHCLQSNGWDNLSCTYKHPACKQTAAIVV